MQEERNRNGSLAGGGVKSSLQTGVWSGGKSVHSPSAQEKRGARAGGGSSFPPDRAPTDRKARGGNLHSRRGPGVLGLFDESFASRAAMAVGRIRKLRAFGTGRRLLRVRARPKLREA